MAYGDPSAIDADARYCPPIVISRPDAASPILREEIFGPLLPVLPFATLDEAVSRANAMCATPLALYIFSERKESVERVLASTSSGGVTVNSVGDHATNLHLPFGGVGSSGMGAYQGRTWCTPTPCTSH